MAKFARERAVKEKREKKREKKEERAAAKAAGLAPPWETEQGELGPDEIDPTAPPEETPAQPAGASSPKDDAPGPPVTSS
jgi:hypothetical protein